MNVNEAVRSAQGLLWLHGLSQEGWSIKLDGAKSRAGVTKHRTKTISLSRSITELWPAENVRDTVLHEIAHALVGPNHGHDITWQRKAREIGCNGQAQYKVTTDTPAVPYRYVGTCPRGHTSGRHKMSKAIKSGASCGTCSPGVFDKRFVFSWVDSRGVRV